MESNYNKYIEELYKNPKLYINEFLDYKDDIYFWPKIIKMYKPKSILEIGIGNGRLINILHKYVEKYDGIDFSPELIDYCRKKYNYNNVSLYNQNLRKCRLNNIYDLIILPFNVINNFYSEDDIYNAFNNIKKLSNKNTIIVIDTINPKIEDLNDREEFIRTNEFNMDGQKILVLENKKYNSIDSTFIYKKRYINNKKKIIKESILPNRIFFHSELQLLIKHYGFEIIDIYGDYNFEKISNLSRKQIFVIRRK